MNERKRRKEKTRNLFRRVLKASLARPEDYTVSQWAEHYRVLDESSALPGKWSNDITPYLVEIMDCFNDPYIDSINFVKPTQVGGTETLINALSSIIDQSPSPTMVVYPTDELAKYVSKTKLQPAFLKSPRIRNKFKDNISKELELRFRGMNLYLRGAGSPSKLASIAIRYLFFDEIDKFPGASAKEASPYDLAKERSKTFKHSRKIYSCSTPTLKTNYVWMLHEQADEVRHYMVPCPHCGEYIEFKWKQVIFAEDPEKKMSNTDRAKTAVYVCQECGCEILDKEKPAMLRAGVWKTIVKRNEGTTRSVSFWLNSLYSIFITWEDAVKEFLDSKDEPERLQNFVNSWLAEPWEDTKLKTSDDLVMERRTDTPQFMVPAWAKFLTGGVDIQETSMYWSIRAWGNHITSQKIANGQCLGFSTIEEVMNKEYIQEDTGNRFVVRLCMVDSGYEADATYDFCVNNSDWALPIKGASNPMATHYKISKVNAPTSKAHGMQLVTCDTDKYKDMIAARMKKENGTGSWMVDRDCDREYAKQVTAEHKINVKEGKKKHMKWVQKISHADNHYLDTEVYNLCAADILGVRTMHLNDIGEEEEAMVKQAEEMERSKEEQWIDQNENWFGQ